jgi:hypothetical protein
MQVIRPLELDYVLAVAVTIRISPKILVTGHKQPGAVVPLVFFGQVLRLELGVESEVWLIGGVVVRRSTPPRELLSLA